MLSKTFICFLLLLVTGLQATYYSDGDGHVEGIELDKSKMRDCVAGPWRCSPCDRKTGWIMCTRDVIVKAAHYGRGCGLLSEKRPCRVNCEMSPFGAFKPCPKTCGTAYTTRRRHVHIHPRNGGKECPSEFDRKICNTKPCDVDCKQSEWDCKPCNKYTGKQKCSRDIIVKPKHYGKKCGAAEEERDCKVHCEMTPFGEYSACSKKCGGGWAVKKREIIHAAMNGGEKCGKLVSKKECNTYRCSVDCKQSEWECHHCDKYTGKALCTRRIIVAPVYKGKPCGKDITMKHCKVDCEVDYWRPWSHCSKKCGHGISTTWRKITIKPLWNGKACPKLKDEKACNIHYCPIHCEQGPWTWGNCDKKTGLAKGTRKTLVAAKYGGRKCGAHETWKHCKVDCEMSKYSGWSECTRKCGGGYKWRTRHVLHHNHYGGKACESAVHYVACNPKPCRINCEQSEWRCGDCDYYSGNKQCTRKVLIEPKHHGLACGSNEKTKKCEVDCKVSKWGNFGACSKTCGGGTKTRTRKVIYEAKNDGRACPTKLSHTIKCNEKICAQDCKQGPWKCYECDKATGKMECRRETLVHPQGHGQACGPTEKHKYCDVDCQVSPFGAFTKCSKKCGTGYKYRERTIIVAPKEGGKVCPALKQTVACNEHHCDRDCQQTEDCGKCNLYTGYRQCYRKITQRPKGNGKKCYPANFEKTCVVDCKLTSWGPFSPCDKTCKPGGYSIRKRTVGHIARNGGKKCDAKRVDRQRCNAEVPCVEKQCGPCPKLYCKKPYVEMPAPAHVKCGCPSCGEPWISNSNMSIAGFAVGGLGLVVIFGFLKRRKENSDYDSLLNSVDAETEDLL